MTIALSHKEKVKIGSSDDLYQVMQRLLEREKRLDRSREHFWTIGLDNRSKILYIELVSIGTANKTLAEPMEVYSIALQKKCSKLVLVHNHPAGDIRPSSEDKDTTDRLIQVGKIVNIEVLDHLIITDRSFYSFSDSGLLLELQASKKYVAPYQLEMENTKAQKKLVSDTKRETAKKKIEQVVKKALKKGYTTTAIAELTGLKTTEIERIKGKQEKK
jgi:DNA repair protein RadC